MKRQAALDLLNKLRAQAPGDVQLELDKLLEFWGEQNEELNEAQAKLFKTQAMKVGNSIKEKLGGGSTGSTTTKVNPKDQSDFTGASKILGTKTSGGSTAPKTSAPTAKVTPQTPPPKTQTLPPKTEPPKQTTKGPDPEEQVKQLRLQLATKLKELSPQIVKVTKAETVPESAKVAQKSVIDESSQLVQFARTGSKSEVEDGLQRIATMGSKIGLFNTAVLLDKHKTELRDLYGKVRERTNAAVSEKVLKSAITAQNGIKSDKQAIETALAGTDLNAVINAKKLAQGLDGKITSYEQTRLVVLRNAFNNTIDEVFDDLKRVLSTKDPGPEAEKVRTALRQDVQALKSGIAGEDYPAMLKLSPLAAGLRGKIGAFDKAKVTTPSQPTTTQSGPSPSGLPTGGSKETPEVRNKRIAENIENFNKLSNEDKQKKLNIACQNINKPGNEKLLESAGAEKYVEYMLALSHKGKLAGDEQKALIKLYGVMKLDPGFMQDDGPRRDKILTGIAGDDTAKSARANWDKGAGLSTNKTKQTQLESIQKIQTGILDFKPDGVQFNVELGNSSGQCSGKLVQFSNKDKLNKDFDDVLDTLVHETTHAYQNDLCGKLKGDLSPNDPEFAKDPRFAQALLFKMNNKPGMYAKPPPDSDPEGKMSDDAWKKSPQLKLLRRAYENEPVEAHAWRAGSEAGRVFDSKAQTIKLVDALKALGKTGLIAGDPRVPEIVKGIKGTISERTGALAGASDFVKEICNKMTDATKKRRELILQAQNKIMGGKDGSDMTNEQIDQWNSLNGINSETIEAGNAGIVLSNAGNWLEAAPFYAKAYETATTAKI